MFKQGHTPSHKGKVITTDPLKTSETVQKIKHLLRYSPRDLALWTLATNTMLRSGDLCALQWDEIDADGVIKLHEGKTDKRRIIPLPPEVLSVLGPWRALCDSPYVFSGQRGPLTTAAWGRMIKDWCRQIGLEGNFSGHTARKTGVRVRYDEHGVRLATLMHMLNHDSEATTLVYMGRMTEEVKHAYEAVI